MKIAISCESTCDLPSEIIKEKNVHIMPLEIVLGDKSYKDGVEISANDIFKYVEQSGELPKTSARGIAEYMDFFNDILKTYDAVIHVGFSSELSCSYQNAFMASNEVKNVFVVDSKNLSSGHGLLCLKAIDMIEKGMEPQQIVEKLNALVPNMKCSFIINTMKYLYKGGRCSTLQYLGANLLKIKPCIIQKEGKLVSSKKYMGKLNDCALKYIEDTLNSYENVCKDLIFVTHSPAQELDIKILMDNLKEKGFKQVYEGFASSTISSHCGPDCVGIIFEVK